MGTLGSAQSLKFAEGAAFDGLLAGVTPFDAGADAAGLGIVTGPVELGRPSGGCTC